MAGVLSKKKQKLYILAFLLLDEDIEDSLTKQNVTRTIRAWLRKRHAQGAYQNLIKEMQIGDQASYTSFFRMDYDTFSELLKKVEPYISKEETYWGTTIEAGERLAITLRFLATGESFKSLQFLFRVSERSISGIVKETCWFIYQLLKEDYFKMPQDEKEWRNIAKKFQDKWNLPHCIGALDGKHVVIRAPDNSGSLYYNYKGSFSIILLALVDADYKFTYIDVGSNGRVADGGVFSNSTLKKGIDNKSLHLPPPDLIDETDIEFPYFIVADDAFPLREDMLKPYPQRNLTHEQRIYNYRLCRARRIVENAFGILANRFRVFLTHINLSPEAVQLICLAACSLHNMLREQRSRTYIPPGIADTEENDGRVVLGRWRSETGPLTEMESTTVRNATTRAKNLRDTFAAYVNSEVGSIHWQENMV